MIIQLKNDIKSQDLKNIENSLEETGLSSSLVKTQLKKYIIALGSKEFDMRKFGLMRGVEDIHYVSDSYQLVSRIWKTSYTEINLGDGVTIGGKDICIIAGPCSIEKEETMEIIADFLVERGVKIMRGGVFKPRTSPYAYRGGGIEALKMFYEICSIRGLKICTEVMDVSQIEKMLPYTDIFQVGTRNAQNFNLLDALGRIDKAVMLKRGMSNTIEELLQAAEYVFSSGNEKIILCERGIRTFENAYRNTFDINAVAILKDKSHLPVIIDPSHGVGIRKYVEQVALAGIIAGANGLIIETHPIPEQAISDGKQNLSLKEFKQLTKKIDKIEGIINDFYL